MKSAALFLSFALLAARAQATLSASVNVVPFGTAQGNMVTVILQVTNNSSANSVTGVSALSGPGLAVPATLMAGPFPASLALAPLATANFTFAYKMTGCGSASFTASASGSELGSAVGVGASSALFAVSCPGTPVVVGTPPSAIPADAKVLGNKFHPGEGGSVGLKYSLPFGGTIHIDIYDRGGNRVRSIIREADSGDNLDRWDGRADDGSVVATGIYAVRFQGKGLTKMAKVVVIK